MTRSLSTSYQQAAEAPVVRPVFMVRLDFASAPVLAHTGVGTITYNGEDYLGVGNLGEISTISEGIEPRPYSINLTLTGIPSAMVSLVLSEHYQGRACQIFLALVDANLESMGLEPSDTLYPSTTLYPSPSAGAVSPIEIWRGRMDYAAVEMGETATVTVTAQSLLADWQRARIRRYSNEDQIAEYPTDKGLEFVAAMVNKDIIWGRV